MYMLSVNKLIGGGAGPRPSSALGAVREAMVSTVSERLGKGGVGEGASGRVDEVDGRRPLLKYC